MISCALNQGLTARILVFLMVGKAACARSTYQFAIINRQLHGVTQVITLDAYLKNATVMRYCAITFEMKPRTLSS